MFRDGSYAIITVRLNGKPLKLDTLISARVQQRLSMPDLCELHYRSALLPQGGLEVGSSLQLEVMGEGASQSLFNGEVTAIEYEYTAVEGSQGQDDELDIVIRAYDRLHRLRKHQRVRSFENTSLEQLARRLSGEHGLGSVKMLAGHSPAWPLLIQHQQSDLEFLVELASQEGLYLTLSSGALEILSLEGRQDTPVRLHRQELVEARLEVNADSSCERVEAYGWSTSLAENQHSASRRARSGRAVKASARAGSVGGSGVRQLVNETAPRREHAQNLAQAELDWRTATEVTLWARVAGSSNLRPGTPVDLEGVAGPFAGRHVLTEAVHSLTEEGFFSEISSAAPEPTSRPRGDVATVGLVSDVRDPRQLGRVQVSLPAYHNVNTGWIPVTLPAAGRNKGFVCLPDVGDRVLVLLARENPAQGIVLGGLYGEQEPPDRSFSPDSQRGRRYTWTTAGGQRIQLNESGDLLRLENGAGALIELRGSDVLIKGKRVDFEQL